MAARQTVSRARGIRGFRLRRSGGSLARIFPRISCELFPSKGRFSVRSS